MRKRQCIPGPGGTDVKPPPKRYVRAADYRPAPAPTGDSYGYGYGGGGYGDVIPYEVPDYNPVVVPEPDTPYNMGDDETAAAFPPGYASDEDTFLGVPYGCDGSPYEYKTVILTPCRKQRWTFSIRLSSLVSLFLHFPD